MSWRTIACVLGLVCLVQQWRACTRDVPEVAPAPAPASAAPTTHAAARFDDRDPARADDEPEPPPPAGLSINGFQIPAWAAWFAPRAGEDLRAYRDRLMPIAMAAVAPQRARVARSRDDFAALVHLDARQREVLDGAAREAASAIEERVLGAALSGDFNPENFKPMTAISAARDVLDVIDRSNKKFLDSLTEDQRAALAKHPFDFADYLAFSTKWEEMLGLTN